ncbi:hypothetical protein Tco_0263577, partial [Tanacetum coccineum]
TLHQEFLKVLPCLIKGFIWLLLKVVDSSSFSAARPGGQYWFKNLLLRSSQVLIELVGSFLSQRLAAPVKDIGKTLSIS